MSMVGRRLRSSALAVIASVAVADSARAADYFSPATVAPAPDFASRWNLRGYVGVGFNGGNSFAATAVDAALNSLSNFYEFNPNGGFGFSRNPSEWQFAYTLYASVGYLVNNNFKIDPTYRYLNYGSITDSIDCPVTCTSDGFGSGDLFSNDFMPGLRRTCCGAPPPPAPRSRG
jgi:hypothetical protein